jgi:hypothetical protein
MSGHALVNYLRAAANDFDARQFSEINTLSAHEYTMVAPV